VALAGVVVCFALGAAPARCCWGFGVDAFVSTAYRVSGLLMGRGTLSHDQVGALFLLLSFLGVVGSAAIVGGLALLLREVGGTKPAPRDAGPMDRP
jgi:hypothetical protein